MTENGAILWTVEWKLLFGEQNSVEDIVSLYAPSLFLSDSILSSFSVSRSLTHTSLSIPSFTQKSLLSLLFFFFSHDENTLLADLWSQVKEQSPFKSKIAYFLFQNELEEKDVEYTYTLCLTAKQGVGGGRGRGGGGGGGTGNYTVAAFNVFPNLSLYDVLRRKRLLEFPTVIVRLSHTGKRARPFHEVNKYISRNRRRPFKIEHTIFDPSQYKVEEGEREVEKEEEEGEGKEEKEDDDIDPEERERMEKELQSLLSLLT